MTGEYFPLVNELEAIFFSNMILQILQGLEDMIILQWLIRMWLLRVYISTLFVQEYKGETDFNIKIFTRTLYL